jgi:DnaJ-class molecular chaperone
MLHPDKQSPENEQNAKERTALLNAAYDTLSDPQKRTIYDMYGIKGLQSGWELTPYQGPEEVIQLSTSR